MNSDVCLKCPLPDCDEKDVRCLLRPARRSAEYYRQKRKERIERFGFTVREVKSK